MVTVGSLYVVGLPIGNPKDITLRALEVLKSVDIIAAEDTRDFNKFAAHHDIKCENVFSHHDHNQVESTKELIKKLKEGHCVALVSDAGTPGVSDPGTPLVTECLRNKLNVVPIPGPSALTSALSVNPFTSNGHHTFLGFPPSKHKERQTLFQSLSERKESLIFYEAPHRICEHFEDASISFKKRKVAVFREMTKPYEEILTGTIDELLAHFNAHSPKGELVIIYSSPEQEKLSESELKERAMKLLASGESTNSAAKILSPLSDLSKSEIYQLIERWKTH